MEMENFVVACGNADDVAGMLAVENLVAVFEDSDTSKPPLMAI